MISPRGHLSAIFDIGEIDVVGFIDDDGDDVDGDDVDGDDVDDDDDDNDNDTNKRSASIGLLSLLNNLYSECSPDF